MPQSSFNSLTDKEIKYPMVFEISNYHSDRRVSHCGVLEFSAKENLKVQEGELVALKNVSLPKGSCMKIQPHETKFIYLSGDPKEILERALKNFACVTAGDTIMITHEYNQYYIDVVETEPSNGISLVETDCEVDFAPPLDYEEPVKKAPIPKAKEQLAGSAHEPASPSEEKPKLAAFTGVARRLDGQPVVSEPSSALEEAAAADHSGEKSLPRKRPAGKLVFGGENRPSNLEEKSKEEIKDKEVKE